MAREFQITKAAVQQGRSFGLRGQTKLRLQRMARRSAPVTSDFGNGRFHEWFMEVSHGSVVTVTRLFDEV